MMQKWTRYFGAQIKRTAKTFPGMLLFTAVLTLGMCLVLHIIFTLNASKEEHQIVKVGVVGDVSDTYLGVGINVLKNLDTIKGMINVESMTEPEARELLAAGEIYAYVVIPDGFINSLVVGENRTITYVTTARAQGLGGALMSELIAEISDMVTLSQNSVYAMQEYLVENGMEEVLWEATDDFNVDILDAFLSRTDIYEIRQTGIANSLSLTGYFFCSVILIFLLLGGINSVSLFAREDASLFKILHMKKYGAAGQVLSELLAYVILMFFSICCVLAAAVFLKDTFGINVPEWDALGAGRVRFIVKLLPVVLMLSAFQAFLYEIVPGVVNGVLAQFISAVSLAYISGCIYPITFFPEIVQKAAYYLPTGVGLRYLQKGLSGSNVWPELLLLLLFAAVFAALQTLERKRRIAGR